MRMRNGFMGQVCALADGATAPVRALNNSAIKAVLAAMALILRARTAECGKLKIAKAGEAMKKARVFPGLC